MAPTATVGTTASGLLVKHALVIAKTYKSHRAKEWIKFLQEVDKQVPRLTEPDEPGGEPHVLQIHIVADNYATHKTPLVQQWLDKHPRFHVHFTPTSSSWLNQVSPLTGLRAEDTPGLAEVPQRGPGGEHTRAGCPLGEGPWSSMSSGPATVTG